MNWDSPADASPSQIRGPKGMAMRLALIAILAAVGAATAAHGACPSGLHRAITAELFFGRDRGGAPAVSDADWKSFLDQEISPRFSAGLSVSDVYGEWREPGGRFIHEPSKAVILVLDDLSAKKGDLAHVRDAYKRRFHQKSVLLVEEDACVSF